MRFWYDILLHEDLDNLIQNCIFHDQGPILQVHPLRMLFGMLLLVPTGTT